ncbi:glycosyltransferase [Hippea maritima]|uniref:Glycosyltransferase sugar-binding region containing DXD motif n=1 Tax=Hippea maritima (strain ATCC 700847 / DSM 10411 / MH2) TaxID=760142 RepID=F2LVV5_HIPMA|nr:glycosyltransferase [Hippea maritima]AEA33889.1 glycosyltransferase sugar-binding region containing DXD motif [Hippea maritima DSM 10411]
MYPNVFQIWYSDGDEIPKKYEVFIEHNKRIFEKIPSYRLYRTSQINKFLKEFNYDLSKFKGFHYRFQSDVIRFLLLYHFGGLYLDLDIKVNDNFLKLLDMLNTEYKNVDAIPQNRRIYFLWFRRHSKNLKKIIDYYMDLSYLDYDYNVFFFAELDFNDLVYLPLDELDCYFKHFVMSG